VEPAQRQQGGAQVGGLRLAGAMIVRVQAGDDEVAAPRPSATLP
jgi:hypothetical protein